MDNPLGKAACWNERIERNSTRLAEILGEHDHHNV